MRYLKTKRQSVLISRVSVIAFIVVVIGVTVPIMVMSIINGFHDGIRSKIIDKDFHLQIYHKDDMFENYEPVIKEIKKINGIKAAYPFFEGKAIIRFGNEKTGIIVRGIVKDMLDDDESFIKNFPIIEGNNNFEKGNRIILGKRLAERLRANVGDIIELYIDKEESSTGFNFTVKRFIVSSIFRSGYSDFDLNLSFISLNDAQKLYNYVSDFFGIIDYRTWAVGVKLSNPDDYNKIRNEIIDKFSDLRVRTYIQLNGNLLYAFEWEKKLMMVVLIIMVIATVLTVMLILTIVVMSKKKEIGILKSFGVGHKEIRRIFIIEGFLISFFGTLIGIILGIVFTVNIREIALFIESVVNTFIDLVKSNWIGNILGIDANTKKWEIISEHSMYSRNFPYKILFSDIFLLSIMTIFWSLVGSLLPAKRATKITVIEAIRND